MVEFKAVMLTYGWFGCFNLTTCQSINPQAHKVLVNSWFTADTFVRTFVPLFRGGMLPRVLYPAVNTQSVRHLSGPMSLL